MGIAIASDHAGFEFKNQLVSFLKQNHFSVTDCGTHSTDSCDYPDFAQAITKQVMNKKLFGILICGTGIGMSMCANRKKGIRAALCTTPEHAKLAREHNNANVLCLGARTTPIETAKQIAQTFLQTPFSGEERHQKRIAKMDT